jgi:hypothetical protein
VSGDVCLGGGGGVAPSWHWGRQLEAFKFPSPPLHPPPMVAADVFNGSDNAGLVVMSADYPIANRAFIMNLEPCWYMVGSPPCTALQVKETDLFSQVQLRCSMGSPRSSKEHVGIPVGVWCWGAARARCHVCLPSVPPAFPLQPPIPYRPPLPHTDSRKSTPACERVGLV